MDFQWSLSRQELEESVVIGEIERGRMGQLVDGETRLGWTEDRLPISWSHIIHGGSSNHHINEENMYQSEGVYIHVHSTGKLGGQCVL